MSPRLFTVPLHRAHPYKNKPIKYYFKYGTGKKWRYGGQVRTNKHSEFCEPKPKKTKKAPTTPVKGPKHGGEKIVFAKSGGLGKYNQVFTY